MNIKKITIKNKEISRIESDFFKIEQINEDMIYILNYFIKKKRFRSASAKNRAQINCSGAKPYGQKGTGRARRGTNSTPLRKGGGVVFGPIPHFVSSKLPKKVVKQGIIHLMSMFKENILILQSENEENLKTKELVCLNQRLNSQNPLYVLNRMDLGLKKACQNIRGCEIMSPTILKPELFLKSDKIIFSENAFNEMAKVYLEQNNESIN